MPKGYHHVTREQRSQISALKAIATPLNKIARVIGLSPSSVCRELKRNTGKPDYHFYLFRQSSKHLHDNY